MAPLSPSRQRTLNDFFTSNKPKTDHRNDDKDAAKRPAAKYRSGTRLAWKCQKASDDAVDPTLDYLDRHGVWVHGSIASVLPSENSESSSPWSYEVNWDIGSSAEDVKADPPTRLYQDRALEWAVYVAGTLGTQVALYFGDVLYKGSVVDMFPAERTEDGEGMLVNILWEDGDQSDMNETEYNQAKQLYEQNRLVLAGKKRSSDDGESSRSKKRSTKRSRKESSKAKKQSKREVKHEEVEPMVLDDDDTPEKATKPTRTQSSRGRARKVVQYMELSDDEEVDDVVPQAKSKRSSRNKKSAKVKNEIDEDNYIDDGDDDVSDEELKDLVDSDESDEEIVLPSKKSTKKSAGAKSSKAKTTESGGRNQKPARTGAKLSESFKPYYYPVYESLTLDEIQKNKQFLDPCGMEATDDIIERLVGDQVDRIGALLCRTLQENPNAIGSLGCPLKLGTACSGTDAPALALEIVKEQMEARKTETVLNYDHVFSCEKEPFKQAYLARNFDSTLYPDICKLGVEGEIPRDVYGREKELPAMNLFVAGTVCKNFSMLRTKYRIDIEDKGESGETFLSAVDILYKEKPEMAIFENVTAAPWEKMQEYISGRIKLSSCGDQKQIKGTNNKKSGNDDLEFSWSKGEVIVERVPPVFGVRCGAAVDGFESGAEGLDAPLQSVHWPSNIPKTKTCTLKDLMRANEISKADDTLVFKTPCRFGTRIVKVDSKMFGLPQTRQRTYMFVWRLKDGESAGSDDLGDYWIKLVRHLQSPVRHSLVAFMLDDDHDVIRVYREALNGPPGRQTKSSLFQEEDYWTSTSANLPHNKNTRKALGLKDTARFFTNWKARGQKQIAPSCWLEYLDCNEARIIDFLDILYASAFRDPEAHDPSFASHFWNLSQNATREHHRAATAGIAGCITPGGDFFVSNRGRNLLGCEKLLIQGIPFFRLLLGNETEVELGDLAGNAMSLTVVSATMLAALTCRQLRDECRRVGRNPKDALDRVCNDYLRTKVQLSDDHKGHKWRGSLPNPDIPLSKESSAPASTLFVELARLAGQAYETSLWCTCESSGKNSEATGFLQCRSCRVSCCRNCMSSSSGYNMSTHQVQEISISCERHAFGGFQTKLRKMLPPAIHFDDQSFSDVNERYRVKGLEKFPFKLHRIKRDFRKWIVIYYAADSNGVGETVAEMQIWIGETRRESIFPKKAAERGVRIQLKSFMPAKSTPLEYGFIEPFAETVVGEDGSTPNWKVRTEPKLAEVTVTGTGETQSPRIEIGLEERVDKDIRTAIAGSSRYKKLYNSAISNKEERRWVYSKNWKIWPSKISIEGDLEISGIYHRSNCRQSINQSALWIKEPGGDVPAYYLLMEPNVDRTGPDQGVISLSTDNSDIGAVVARFPLFWEPCDALDVKLQQVKLTLMLWKESVINMAIPPSKLKVSRGDSGGSELALIEGLTEEDVSMFIKAAVSNSCPKGTNVVTLNMSTGQKAQRIVRVFNALCANPLVKFAADNIGYDLSANAKWTSMPQPSNGALFGLCTKTVPPRPKESWIFDEERKIWTRTTEPDAARNYYKALVAAPSSFYFILDLVRRMLRIGMAPEVPCHRAAHMLLSGRGDEVSAESVQVAFRLSDLSLQEDPKIVPFTIHNSVKEAPTNVPLKVGFCLYLRQQKVVTKMIKIERGETFFDELEVSEDTMPGSTGLSLLAKAERTGTVRGGVIADAIGAGKTVISIALILNTIKESRRFERVHPWQSKATLVLMPPALILQWESEIRKFSPFPVEIVKIFDAATLTKTKLRSLVEADVVLCPVDILESPGYFANLIKKSGLKGHGGDVPKLPPYTGQTEQYGARGTYIPATSTDPYGGGHTSKSQSYRNQAAYFTHMYETHIFGIREKHFGLHETGVPLEYLQWDRLIVDEIHESLCTTKAEIKIAQEDFNNAAGDDATSGFFKERNRRAGRELLGIMQKDLSKRPLRFRKAIFGLTGTPLLDSTSRVTELANLMGGVYVTGLSSHWRKLERESRRDIFLSKHLEPKQSREIRKAIFAKCQDYLETACCRNKTGEEMKGIQQVNHLSRVRMSAVEKADYLKSQSGIPEEKRSLGVKPEDFDPSAGADISKFLRQNVSLESRGSKLVEICKEILDGNPSTKIVVFCDGRIGGGAAAVKALNKSGIGCTSLDREDSVELRTQKISWYQHPDCTDEDRKRPRVLVLHFDHAAGLNLQAECNNLILFSPLYCGEGGFSGDPVADVSTELQAIGRVMRPGQRNSKVNVFRIEVRGPDDDDCFDNHIILRNTDEGRQREAVGGET